MVELLIKTEKDFPESNLVFEEDGSFTQKNAN